MILDKQGDVVSERYTEEQQMTSNAPYDSESRVGSIKNSVMPNLENSADGAFEFGRPKD